MEQSENPLTIQEGRQEQLDYKLISQTSIPGKIFTQAIEGKINEQLHENQSPEQASFRIKFSTRTVSLQ